MAQHPNPRSHETAEQVNTRNSGVVDLSTSIAGMPSEAPPRKEAVRRPTRVMLAFMSPHALQNYAATQATDPAAMMAAFQQRAAYLATATEDTAVPRIEDVPASFAPHLAALMSHARFAEIYANSEIKMIELGKVITYQGIADIGVAEELFNPEAQGPPTDAELLSVCLPTDLGMEGQVHGMADAQGLSLCSMKNSFKVGLGFDPTTQQWVVASTFNPNLLSVKEHAGKFYLNNGNHRAYALRSRGIEMAPVIITRVANDDGIVPVGGPIDRSIVFGKRPPRIDDFFNESISATVETKSFTHVARVSVNSFVVPRLLA